MKWKTLIYRTIIFSFQRFKFLLLLYICRVIYRQQLTCIATKTGVPYKILSSSLCRIQRPGGPSASIMKWEKTFD